jgi:hypothetical protein
MTDTAIIGGPIAEGCFVRLRDGTEIGPVAATTAKLRVWGVGDIISWEENGQFCRDAMVSTRDIIEVLPARAAAPAEPSYEQKLWDEAALKMLGGLQPSAEAASKTADAFMAERAKRIKL